MEIIPVIDLKGGLVVRARQGDRANYRPIQTPLSPTSEPEEVVAGLLALHPFTTVYVADLDAIERADESGAVFDRIAARFPGLRLWIDNGCAEKDAAEGLLARLPNASLVLGSESQADTVPVRSLLNRERVILSLDFRGDAFQGPAALLADCELWPGRVIVMTLARVGSGAGPDLQRLATIRARGAGRRVFAAGGLRDARDLASIALHGGAGVLVASALHDGRLSASDLSAHDASG